MACNANCRFSEHLADASVWEVFLVVKVFFYRWNDGNLPSIGRRKEVSRWLNKTRDSAAKSGTDHEQYCVDG